MDDATADNSDLNLLEYGEHGDRIHGGDEGGEEEGLQDAGGVVLPVQARLPHPPQGHTSKQICKGTVLLLTKRLFHEIFKLSVFYS